MEEHVDHNEDERGNPSVQPEANEGTHKTATGELASMLSHEGTYEEPTTMGLEEEEEDRPLNWSVIAPAGIAVLAVVCWGLIAPENFANFATSTLDWIVANFGWAFILFTTIFVGFALAIGFSKFGSIKLGRDDEQPEFSTPSWIAMMFAAGMGIGLMFYGTTEPLTFFRQGVPGHDPENMRQAMASTLFHWTLHPWAIYAIVGLSIAYITFRRGKKQLLSAAFIPLIGEKAAEGVLGKIIDILAIFATVFGTACSLGLGALQMALFEETAETKLIEPTFIIDYPVEISPLARASDANHDVTERFELFIAGRELGNGFSELNDPDDQAARFKAQADAKSHGDDEAMYYDADYIRALEYGLPPTAGCGVGIDRFIMLLTDAPTIRDVLLFPHMRPESGN